MPSTTRIDKEQGVVFIELNDPLRPEQILAAQNKLRDDLDFSPDFRGYFDLRGVTEVKLSISEIDRVAKNSPFDGSGRRAFLADRDAVRGFVRTYERLSIVGKGDVQLFEDMAKAKEWLGID